MPAKWLATDPALFFTKNDSNDLRLGDCVQSASASDLLTSPENDLVIWGYPDDEGISLNKGRLGAREAPTEIRRVFYKMTPHVELAMRPRLLDLGNVSTEVSLAERHDLGAGRAQAATDSGLAWCSLGGGHDYGYADGAGFIRSQLAKGRRPLVVNLDAHLDVRPSHPNLNSGTPFYRLLTEFQNDFDFVEIGLQPHCNSRIHWDWAQSRGAKLTPLSQVLESGWQTTISQVLSPHRGQPLWLSLDIDAITSNEAPGCSQSWTTGLQSAELLSSLAWFKSAFDWRAFSIYEVSPPLDSDNRTVKLAALFLHRYLSLQMGIQK
jgi:formiminoglutamase